MGWLSDLFRWNTAIPNGGTTGKNYFYPVSFQFESKNPVLIDCAYGALFNVYRVSPHLLTIINRGAEMFSNAQVILRDQDGKAIESHKVLDLMRKPTPVYSFEQWAQWVWVMNAVYGNTFLYENKAFATIPKTIWPLFSGGIRVMPTGKVYDQVDVKGMIEKYEYAPQNGKSYFPEDIIQISTGVSDESPLVGASKIPGLQYHISNCNAALKTRNILLTERGAFGILSNSSNDGDGGIPLGDEERKRIEEEYRKRYGLGPEQAKFITTTANLKWTPMSFPTKDLLAFEETEDNFSAICAAYGMARDLFPSLKGATFENYKQAQISTYQSTIQPFADLLSGVLTERWAAELPTGSKLEFDYSWLPVMQENAKEQADTMKANVDSVVALVSSNVANPAQARQILSQVAGIAVDDALESTDSVLKVLSGSISPLLGTKFADALTLNRIRQAMGEPPLPAQIGDVPLALLKQQGQQQGGQGNG